MRTYAHSDSLHRCTRCGEQFIFTAGERELCQLRGIDPVPTRCPPCSGLRRKV